MTGCLQLFIKGQRLVQIERLVQIKSFCRRYINSYSDKICLLKGRKHFRKKEKMLVSSIFSFFPRCFQKTSSGFLKHGID